MSKFNYTQAPSQEIFDDMLEQARNIWKTYDDTHGYQTEKLERLKDLENFKDNYWTIIGMFDGHNQIKLISQVKPETAEFIVKAIKG